RWPEARCFNPRARTGRDATARLAWFVFVVSIHAPARGATQMNVRFTLSEIVSIHAPARGATLNSSCCYPFGLVSIHAPARGATKADEEAREGNKFQSTRPHGARR